MCLRMVDSESMGSCQRSAVSSQHKPQSRIGASGVLSEELGLSRKVSLLQYPPMMQLMPRDDVGEPPHADFVLVRDTATGPRCLVEIAQQRQRGAAHGDEVLTRSASRRCAKRPLRN